jgi:multicomponent Na+:H+ antiporter subunit B
MSSRFDSVVVRTTCQLLLPFIQMFGIYVLFHGHYSPGGGFQAGAILAASLILSRLALRAESSRRLLSGASAVRLGAGGVLLFAAVGLLPLLRGGAFLDYAKLPLLGLSPAMARYYGILAVEFGVMLAVCGVMLSIFDDLAGAPEDEESA